MSDLKVATWNLYQFAEPGTYWYERQETNDYEPDQWADKQAWMADMIAQLDADIIGFQEVFSVAAFKTFMTAQGYPHVAVVDDAAVDPDDPAVFVRPVTGIASRHPFAAPPAPLAYPQDMRDGTQLQDDFDFRRAIIRAEVITPQFGTVTVYVCHFKSQGARVDGDEIAALPDWRARFREHFRVRAIKDADQMARRNGEAAGVSCGDGGTGRGHQQSHHCSWRSERRPRVTNTPVDHAKRQDREYRATTAQRDRRPR